MFSAIIKYIFLIIILLRPVVAQVRMRVGATGCGFDTHELMKYLMCSFIRSGLEGKVRR